MKRGMVWLAFVAFFGVTLTTSCTRKCEHATSKEASVTQGLISSISENEITDVKNLLVEKHGQEHAAIIERGLRNAARYWMETDGSAEEFKTFCLENYVKPGDEKKLLFERIERNFQIIEGYANQIRIDLMKPVHLTSFAPSPVDMIFGSYNVLSHFNDDSYNNKLAFTVMLNFPFYSLKEKSELGDNWSSLEWAYARLGDKYQNRAPAKVLQEVDKSYTFSSAYIANYNIVMGNLLNNDNERLFPENMKLITHWGLRDELKSNYAGKEGLAKQEMIYSIMQRIISQEIPEKVINSEEYLWNPYTNESFTNNEKVQLDPEPNTRYQHLLNGFHANQKTDAWYPLYESFIQRRFENSMEIPLEEIEQLFISLVSSPQTKKAGKFISERLGRPLRPFDIWYDGFKARSSFDETELDKTTRKRFPTPEAFHKSLAGFMTSLGWTKEKADYIVSFIAVEGSRGAGHAWGAQMPQQKSYLRTRIAADGMDYKGYNIAIHEFGHNVEQTISLHDVPYGILNGVPNTAFTEALAFLFQKRDLELLGIKDNNADRKYLLSLDRFWSTYEIMGVSLVDISVWRWMYENPDANASELKEAVIRIAKDVWNKYYADVFGEPDSPILAIYSHMISSPLYLSAYPLGLLIEFQIEEYISNKVFADEVNRMFAQGRLIPQLWMKRAVGNKISAEPMLKAVDQSLEKLHISK